ILRWAHLRRAYGGNRCACKPRTKTGGSEFTWHWEWPTAGPRLSSAAAGAMSTGGLGLIGSATARRLVALGAEVLLVDSMITSPAIIFRENSASASRPL